MYDRVVQHDFRGSNLPAGVISLRRDSAPLVHRHHNRRSVEVGGWNGEWINSPVEEDIRIRFTKYSEADRNESLFLYEDLEDLKLRPFEYTLGKMMQHLQSVAAAPVLDLNREELKLPVSRVKRFSSRAVSELSCHSEDWLRRTFTSVIPNRLLAEIQSDQWDTYENRLMVTLCRDIEHYLEKRLREINQLKNACEEIQAIYDGSISVANPLRDRFMKRIDSYFRGRNRNNEESSLEETKEKLEALLRMLKRLRNRELFKRVTAKGRIDNIHMTNLLQNHPHYRYLMILHRALIAETGDVVPTVEEFESNQRCLVEGVAAYVECCCRASLSEIGFKELGKHGFQYVTKSLRVSVRREGSDIVLKESLGNRSLRFVALPTSPDDYYDKEKTDGSTIIAYPSGDGSGPKSLSLSGFLGDGVGVPRLPLSPLSLYSEEMIAGILFRWLMTHQYEYFPFRIEKVPTLLQEFIKSEDEFSTIHAATGANEICLFNMPTWYDGKESITQKYQEFCKERRKTQVQLPKNTFDDIDRGFRSLRIMFTCPNCHHTQPQYGIKASDRQFEISCHSCETFKWGASSNGRWFVRGDWQPAGESNIAFAGRFTERR